MNNLVEIVLRSEKLFVVRISQKIIQNDLNHYYCHIILVKTVKQRKKEGDWHGIVVYITACNSKGQDIFVGFIPCLCRIIVCVEIMDGNIKN